MPYAMRTKWQRDRAKTVSLLTQMAGILASAGQGERAVKLLDRAIELDPTSGDPYFTKGLLLLNLKRQPEAEQAIRAGLARAPESAVGPLSPGAHPSRCGERGRGGGEFGAGDCGECLV